VSESVEGIGAVRAGILSPGVLPRLAAESSLHEHEADHHEHDARHRDREPERACGVVCHNVAPHSGHGVPGAMPASEYPQGQWPGRGRRPSHESQSVPAAMSAVGIQSGMKRARPPPKLL
jgi:hypothetical protein